MVLNLSDRRRALGYARAIVFVALATALRFAFLGVLGTRVAFITFYPAVVLAALFGGLPAGLLATVLSALAADYFWMEPFGSLAIQNEADWLAMAIFLISGTMISGTAEAMHRAQARASKAEAAARLAEERQKADLELRKFVSLADNSSEFIGMCDMKFMPFYVNECGLRLVGLASLEQLSRTPVQEFFFPEDQRFVIEDFFPRVLREGRAEVEIRFRHFQTGEALWMTYTVFYIQDAEGQPAGLATVSRNITERMQAEAALRESEAQFRTLANAIPQLCWMANADGWIFWYNQRWYEYTGTTPEQMEGWGWQSVHDRDVLPEVMVRWEASIASGEPFDMVFPLRGADGVFHPFLTRIMPVRDGNGKVARWFGTNTDISEQRKIEQALRESEERLRLAQQAARVGTFEWNMQTGVNRWTPELEAMYGLPPGAFAGTQQTWEDLVYPEDRPEALRRVEVALETGSFEGEWRVRWPDGTLRWLFGRAWVFKDESGRLLRLIGVNVDITERKLAEQQIRQLNAELEKRVRARTAQLEAANRELEAFAYSVSHDLRAPLRGIDGWSFALLEDYAGHLDGAARKYLDRVRSEAQRMGLLIDDLLQLSQITRSAMERTSVDLTSTATTIAARLREASAGRRIDFVIGPGLTAAGDGRLLEIALTNLFENAVKFTGPRDQARIEFDRMQCDGEPAFYVRDNGVGFDMAYAGALFGAFQRLHKTTEFPGTGVGLATVKRVIHRHGGRVWADAQPGQGATFYFTLGAA